VIACVQALVENVLLKLEGLERNWLRVKLPGGRGGEGGGVGWGLGALPSSPFSPLSLCPNFD